MSNKTLTRAHLAEAIQFQTGLSKAESSHFVKMILDEITEALSNGESVKIAKFGTFQVREKAARTGRNPKTGVEAVIPARKILSFKTSQALKDKMESETE